jgi:Ion channel
MLTSKYTEKGGSRNFFHSASFASIRQALASLRLRHLRENFALEDYQEREMKLKSGSVRTRAKGIIVDTWQSQANLSLFLVLQVLIAFILPAIGFGREDFHRYTALGYSVMLISGVAIGWGRPKVFVPAAIIGAVALVFRWLVFWRPTPVFTLWNDWTTIVAVLAITVILLTQIFREGRVTHMRIQGAIAVYLLMGAGWAHAYHIAAVVHPGSFNFPAGEYVEHADWNYFSFVTLTTVGYGDITPVHPIARTLAVAEALTGQLYLAVMIARLVAMEMVFWQAKASSSGNS